MIKHDYFYEHNFVCPEGLNGFYDEFGLRDPGKDEEARRVLQGKIADRANTITKHVKSEREYTWDEFKMGNRLLIYNPKYLSAVYQQVFAPRFCGMPINKSISVSSYRERIFHDVKSQSITMEELYEFQEVTASAIRMACQIKSQVPMPSITADSDKMSGDMRELESEYDWDRLTSISRCDVLSPMSLRYNTQPKQFRSHRLENIQERIPGSTVGSIYVLYGRRQSKRIRQ